MGHLLGRFGSVFVAVPGGGGLERCSQDTLCSRASLEEPRGFGQSLQCRRRTQIDRGRRGAGPSLTAWAGVRVGVWAAGWWWALWVLLLVGSLWPPGRRLRGDVPSSRAQCEALPRVCVEELGPHCSPGGDGPRARRRGCAPLPCRASPWGDGPRLPPVVPRTPKRRRREKYVSGVYKAWQWVWTPSQPSRARSRRSS